MSSRQKRIVLISPASSQPRFHRRAEAFLRAGFSVTTYTFHRGLYEVNTYPPGVDVVSLGRMWNRKYLRRMPLLVSAIVRIKDCERAKAIRPALTYAFGLDSAVLACTTHARVSPIVYEVGDVRIPSDGKGIARMAHIIERHVVRRIDHLVVTAPRFISDHYALMDANIGAKSTIMENKISGSLASAMDRPPPRLTCTARCRIGFVGMLRYARTLKLLMDAVSVRPDLYELHIFGDGPVRPIVEAMATSCNNIYYQGTFKNPQDLAKIYSSIDVSYVAYDNADHNVRMAIPNKLYESLYFCVPLVVSTNTALALRVERLGIGFVIDPDDPDCANRLLNMLNPVEISKRSIAAARIPTEELLDDGTVLVERLRHLWACTT